MDLCINTQTPLLQFSTVIPENGQTRYWPDSVDLSELKEGADYRFSPGGVTRMVFPLVKWLHHHGRVHAAHWVALNPNGPPVVRLPGLTLHNLRLPSDKMPAYGRTKEAIWSAAHGTGPGAAEDLFWSEEFSEYAFYNRRTAEYLRRLDQREDFDVFYIHDFQQLQVGQMLDTLKPKIFRWHIPFEADAIPAEWRPVLSGALASYDVVVVSSDRYRDALRSFGHAGRIVRLYPYVDPAEYGRPGPTEIEGVCQQFGIRPEEVVILTVARMDPMKGLDRALRAFARIAPEFPTARLVLVGNGSFSSSAGGVGLSKGAQYRADLEQLALTLGISDRVTFTGHVRQSELDALYERCRFTVLPSVREGFGLVVVESWLHDRPVIVSRNAGVAELVRDGENGLLVDPDDLGAMAGALRRLLERSSPRRGFTRAARDSAEVCSLETAMHGEMAMLDGLVEI